MKVQSCASEEALFDCLVSLIRRLDLAVFLNIADHGDIYFVQCETGHLAISDG